DFDFKPTPPQRSFGAQLLHVAHTNLQLLKCLGSHAALPRLPEDASAKPDILRALDGSYEYGVAVIGGFTNVVLLQAVAGPEWMGAATRVKVIHTAIAHAQNVYGQLAV